MTGNLASVLKMFAPFADDELKVIGNHFKLKTVLKNEILLREGSVCKHFYFIHIGGIRTFFTDMNGHEKTRYIMLKNHLGTALTSFTAQKPSVECIEAFEVTELSAIHHTDFYRLINEMENFSKFYQRILEMAYAFQNRKIEQRVRLTAKQRYDQIMQESPELIQQVSNRILASYLDIREETLSRLKSG